MQHVFQTAAYVTLGAIFFLGGAVAANAEGLPGGATSLSETHGDWNVACAIPEGTVHCTISQTQVRGENRQRVLAIELAAAESGNTATGTLLLPFGLKLEEGVSLAIDAGAPLQTLRFSTCLPAGCLVPLTFSHDATTAMRQGTALLVSATANDSGQKAKFSISLAGFASALARAAELDGD